MRQKTKAEKLKQISDEVFNLKKSPLYEYRNQNNYYPVLGEGNHDAEVMFVGEAPGVNEAKQGKPFCGAAGKVLDKLFESIAMDRKSVYITNIVKDRPPSNRDPASDEIAIYAPFLMRQIEIIQPKIIVTLGRISMAIVFQEFGLHEKLQTIGKMHGRVFDAEMPYENINPPKFRNAKLRRVKIVVLYHPAVGTYNPNTIDVMKQDFQIIKKLIGKK
ncbi:MAG: uracil-DNA glycosylase [bacterium]|nr:uracil-DNA glycosylase [bacterium]